jgi:hypothetical protein
MAIPYRVGDYIDHPSTDLAEEEAKRRYRLYPSTFAGFTPPTDLAGNNKRYENQMPGVQQPAQQFQSSISDQDFVDILKRAYPTPQEQLAIEQQRVAMYEPIFRQRAEANMRYGIISNAVASLLKDVPQAFAGIQRARSAYDPQRFATLRSLQQPVNIPTRNYFG